MQKNVKNKLFSGPLRKDGICFLSLQLILLILTCFPFVLKNNWESSNVFYILQKWRMQRKSRKDN